jgi:Glycosyltransferase Family 4
MIVKKVLILAYDFPPYVSVGGLRPKSWFDYLKEYDVEPIVITRQWSNRHGNALDYVDAGDSPKVRIENLPQGTIIHTPYKPNLSNRLLMKYGENRFKIPRKIITAYFEFVQFFLPVGPKIELYKSAKKYLKENNVDCILATGEPFVLFHYANKLSKNHQIPWLADYRDSWSSSFETRNHSLERKWHEYFEKKIASKAEKIITVSKFLEKKIKSLIGVGNYHILPNGFDPEAMNNAMKTSQKNDKLRIAIAGSILPWNAFDHFLNTFSTYVKKHPDTKINLVFYGSNISDELEKQLRDDYEHLYKFVEIVPKIANRELLVKLAESNALLLFNNYFFMGTKIYDYLGIQRKIILCFSDDEIALEEKKRFFPSEGLEDESDQLQADLIEKTNAGIVVKDAEHLLSVFDELNNEFILSGEIKCESIQPDEYSRKHQVQLLAEIIHSI